MQVMSWEELIIVLLVLGAIWYAYVLVRYYPHLFTKGRRGEAGAPVRKPDQHAQVHELMEELKLIFEAGARHSLVKETIVERISARLPHYAELPRDIKLSVAQHIASEFSLQLKITVTPEEMNSLWNV